MQQIEERLSPQERYTPEDLREFEQWAGESRNLNPFVDLAMHWDAGLLTIAEGRRIEADQQLAQFLQREKR